MAKERIEIAQAALDLSTLQGDVKTAERMINVLKSNVRDLSNLRVNANGELSGGLNQFNNTLDQSNKKYGSGKELIKDFYREQRVQDRVTRDLTTTVVGLTVGLSALVSQSDNTDAGIKRVTTSLLTGVTAMQGAEFMATAAGIAGRNFTGVLGQMAGFLSKNAGLIGIVVGVGASLISFFRESGEEARKAAEGGLTDFENKLKGLSPTERVASISAISKELKTAREQLEALESSTLSVFQFNAFLKDILTGDEKLKQQSKQRREEQIAEINERITLLENLYERAKKVNDAAVIQEELQKKTNQLILDSSEGLNKINAEIQYYNDELKRGNEYNEEGLRYADLIADAERKRSEFNKSTDQQLQKQRSLLADQYSLGKMTTEEYLRQLEVIRAGLKDKEKAREIEKAIYELSKSTKEAEIERTKTASAQRESVLKETTLLILQTDEELVQARTKSEEEKAKVTMHYALRRLEIEEDTAYAILEIERRALEERLKLEKNPERRKDLEASLRGNFIARKSLLDEGAARREGIQQTGRLGIESAQEKDKKRKDSIKGDLVDEEGEFQKVTRLTGTLQINSALINEEKKLASIEKQILAEKDAARLEDLNREREASLTKISILENEVAVREQLAEQQILAGVQAYDAAKSLDENFKSLTRNTINRLLSEAVASQMAKVIASVPFPLNALIAPTAGMAISALFERLIPKFGKGTKATKATLGIFGEAGNELLMPEQEFYDIARKEIIPRISEIAKQDLIRSSTVINNRNISGGSVDIAPLVEEMRMTRREFSTIVRAIKEMPEPVTVLNNPIDFRDALKKEYPSMQDYYKKKYPDG